MSERRIPVPKEERDFYDLEQIASSTECTGLMPAMPQDADEQLHLEDKEKLRKQKHN